MRIVDQSKESLIRVTSNFVIYRGDNSWEKSRADPTVETIAPHHIHRQFHGSSDIMNWILLKDCEHQTRIKNFIIRGKLYFYISLSK